MSLELNLSDRKRFFSVPCVLVDSYLKLADGPALKVILYLIASEDSPDKDKIISDTGVTPDEFDEAVMFWKSLGMIKEGSDENIRSAQAVIIPEHSEPPKEPAVKKVRTGYHPKDIAEMLGQDPGLKELFSEAESTLGRILRHADHETLIGLRDYYGFSEESIVLILGYCSDLGKTSARYYETVAKGLFEKGITEFHLIESEFEKMRERHSFEAKIKNAFGLEINLTARQSEYISSWREMGFGADMISLAGERCADNTNKISFQYIDKILKSWHDKGYFTPEAAENDVKPKKTKEESSFDLDEFDMFTLGADKETK